MTDTFNWPVRIGAQGDETFRVREARFGEGYRQASPDGPNNDVQNWSVSFIGVKADAQAVVDFLRSHQGATSFYWTPPLGTQGYYKCGGFKPTALGGDVYQVDMTFEQDFKP